MNELLLIVGLALLVDLMLSWITPMRKVPNVRVEESPFGTILVSDDILTEADRKEILEAFDSLKSPSGNTTSKNVNKAKEIVGKAKKVNSWPLGHYRMMVDGIGGQRQPDGSWLITYSFVPHQFEGDVVSEAVK